MATLANIFNRFTAVADAAEADGGPRTLADESCRLRALPNEDVYFFVKRIDNTRVVKAANPDESARNWKVAAGGGLAATLAIAALLPSAYGVMAGYQLNQLRVEHQRLINERATLELEEARLVSPERLQELAAQHKFSDPAPDRVVYLQSKDASLALNRP